MNIDYLQMRSAAIRADFIQSANVSAISRTSEVLLFCRVISKVLAARNASSAAKDPATPLTHLRHVALQMCLVSYS